MSEQTNFNTYPEEEEFSFKQYFKKRLNDLKYLWSLRLRIGIACIAGALLGVALAWLWPVTYTARLTFVVEESKPGGGSLVSALAGQFGFDMGSLGGAGGVLAGDNVLELLKSRKMVRETLLTPYADNPKYTLADRYADSYNLKKKWLKHTENNKPVEFPANDSTYTRLQDSLMHVMIKRITENELSVSKPDKKLSFFALNTTMKDESLSQLFCLRLIDQASQFYIQTKTKRQRTNVNRLQARADSITTLLNRKTYTASAANQVLLDVNPAYPTANVGVEVQERDKVVLQTIYAEIIKNLEVSRTMLMQETPTFQIVDEPGLPLKENKIGYLMGLVIGVFIATALYSVYLLAVKD